MGKNKRGRLVGSSNKKSKVLTPKKTLSTLKTKSATISNTPKKAPPPKQHVEPVIPFSSTDRILLIGEGDLSFARSLVEHHDCENVVATVLEKDHQELLDKYPQVVENVAVIEEKGSKVFYGVDAAKMGVWGESGGMGRGTGTGKMGRGRGGMDRVFFNFPHVGGKSTDVNRQVRYNQGTVSNHLYIRENRVMGQLIFHIELLVSFFKRALPSLAPGGSIIVTLFEGEPYTLWNIRDLGRHSGLQVERSFKFQSSAYPGYHHARTLGVVKSKTGEAGVGWKGEDRPARSYIFVRKGDIPVPTQTKRKRDEDSEDEVEVD